MRALLQRLNADTADAIAGGGQAAAQRHLARGKLLPRERIARILDPGSPFLELSPLAGKDLYGASSNDIQLRGVLGQPNSKRPHVSGTESVASGGIVTGIGRVHGGLVAFAANDATVKGGTYYPVTVKVSRVNH